MSSHREAPEISKDPVADSTDVYAFVSPDKPDTVTIIANYLPLQQPDGGPNFYEFGDDVQYDIKINYDNTPGADLIYRFTLQHQDPQPRHVPLQHRPDQLADLEELEPAADLHGDQDRRARQLHDYEVLGLEPRRVPPCNVGVRSTPNYAAIAHKADHTPSATARSSAASAPTPSGSTWAASSTSVGCVRSTRRT